MHTNFCDNAQMEIHDRLRKVREDAGFATAKDAAEAMGVSYFTYAQHENGTRGFPYAKAALYARKFKVSTEWIMTGKSSGAPDSEKIAEIPIIGRVSAGTWMPYDELDQREDQPETVPAVSSYPVRFQFALIVDGNSVNKVAQHGEILICLDAATSGVIPKDNDLVVVERRRFDGAMIQLTAKRLRQGLNGLELWPESTDPAHQTPIPYNENKGDEVSIRGKVLYVLRKV